MCSLVKLIDRVDLGKIHCSAVTDFARLPGNEDIVKRHEPHILLLHLAEIAVAFHFLYGARGLDGGGKR